MFSFDNLLDRVISPRALLLGVVVGFAACALGGRLVTGRNHFRNFERFTAETDYRTNYLVGANQVRALLRESVRPDQIAVVVGGNSVLHGCGQGRDGAWTRQLQAELGDRYRVINLALPGLSPQEFGTVAAEMLYRDGHHRVIVLTNTWLIPTAPIGEPDGRPVVQWFFHDASARGLLLDCPEREARLAQPLTARVDGGTDRAKRDELLRLEALDRWMNFRDLWNGFEYKYAVTVWCTPLAKTWYRARKNYPDSDPTCPPGSQAFLDSIQPQVFEPLRNTIAALRPVVRRPSGAVIPPGELGGPYPAEEELRASFPAPMRERLIVVVTRQNPHFLGLLTADERITYDTLGPAMAAIYARAGVTMVEVGREYTPDDYYDHLHLTVAGGRRMAADLAGAVRQRARHLGYLEESHP
jgi:hypothetical protein